MSEMSLKVLSPLHIGNGRELTPLDIYPGGGILHVLDTERLVGDLISMGVNFGEILHLLKSPPGDSYVWKGYIDGLGLNPLDYSKYSLRVHGEIGKRSMTIREFMKMNGKPYIPGSSVKGAIRTAVLYKVLRECGDSKTAMGVVLGVKNARGEVEKKTQGLAEEISWSEDLVDFYLSYLLKEIETEEPAGKKGRRHHLDRKRVDDLLEALVFGMEPDWRLGVRYEPKRDPMRVLIVRDSDAMGRKHLAVYRVDVLGNSQPIPIWVEALEPGTTVGIEIKVDTELLRMNLGHFNGVLWECLKDRGTPWDVFEDFLGEAIDEFYGVLVRAELEEVKKYGRMEADVRAFYTSLAGYGGYLLRLGWGSGWLAMTIGVLLRSRRKWERVRKKLGLGRNPQNRNISAEFPKTRRLADGMPMGWVMIG